MRGGPKKNPPRDRTASGFEGMEMSAVNVIDHCRQLIEAIISAIDKYEIGNHEYFLEAGAPLNFRNDQRGVPLNRNAPVNDYGHGGTRVRGSSTGVAKVLVGLWVISTVVLTTGWWAGLAFFAVRLMQYALS
jgi:hypothetical protein